MTVGDVIRGLSLIVGDFIILGDLDEEVVQIWVLRRAPDARIMPYNLTPHERPMKDWVPGLLVIVEDYRTCALGIFRSAEGYLLLQIKK